MRRQQNTSGFNKEKLAFLGGSVAFALALYLFLSTTPVALDVGKPIGTQDKPVALANVTAARPLEENFYVMPGTVSRMIDPRTMALVNRERKTPFAPKSDFTKKINWPAAIALNAPPPPPPPPPPPAVGEKITDKKKKEFGAADREAEVAYMGVVTINGQTYGLLKPKDGGPAKRVKVGDQIPDYEYTVTKIDPQAVWLVDKDKHPYQLRDSRFSDETTLADASKKDDGAGAEGKPDKTDKADKNAKPAPEKAPPKNAKPAPEKTAGEKPAEKAAADGPGPDLAKKAAAALEGLDPVKMKKLEEMLKRRENMKNKAGK